LEAIKEYTTAWCHVRTLLDGFAKKHPANLFAEVAGMNWKDWDFGKYPTLAASGCGEVSASTPIAPNAPEPPPPPSSGFPDRNWGRR
jgi:hypothetical protein